MEREKNAMCQSGLNNGQSGLNNGQNGLKMQ